jgi:hypothetical protein
MTRLIQFTAIRSMRSCQVPVAINPERVTFVEPRYSVRGADRIEVVVGSRLHFGPDTCETFNAVLDLVGTPLVMYGSWRSWTTRVMPRFAFLTLAVTSPGALLSITTDLSHAGAQGISGVSTQSEQGRHPAMRAFKNSEPAPIT